MAYSVNRTDGRLIAEVEENTIDTSRSVKFVGRKTTGFGEVQNENFLQLMEHFANTTAPSTPVLGQIYYNKTDQKIRVCTSESPVAWQLVQFVNTARPASPSAGDLYFNSGTNKLEVYTGTVWLEVGPADANSAEQLVENVSTSSGLPSNSVLFEMTESTAWGMDMQIIAHDPSTGTDIGSWKVLAAARRAGSGTAAIVGTPSITTVSLIGSASTQPWSVAISANANSVQVTVTGQSADNTVNWTVVNNVAKVS